MQVKHWNKKRVRPIYQGPRERVTWLAVGLGLSGMYSLEGIAHECSVEAGKDITVGQVHYWLALHGVSIREIRNDPRGSRERRKMRKLVEVLTNDSVADRADRVRYIGTRYTR